MEPFGQSFKNIIELATPRSLVRGNQLVISAANFLVEPKVRSATQTASLCVLVKDPADKERVIANVGTEQERLFRRHALKCDQHIRDTLLNRVAGGVRRAQYTHSRKGFQQRGNVIAQFPVEDSCLLQNVTGQYVEIELGRDAQMCGIGKNRVDEPGMIENGITDFGIAEKINQRNVICF